MSKRPVPPFDLNGLDNLIDNPFGIGPFSRSIKADDWWVVTGMHVRLPEALADHPAGTSKLLIFADTISIGASWAANAGFGDLSEVLLICDTLDMHDGVFAHRNMLAYNESFRMTVFSRNPTPGKEFVVRIDGGSSVLGTLERREHRWTNDDVRTPSQFEFHFAMTTGLRPDQRGGHRQRQLPMPDAGPGFDACREFLARVLLTAQSVFDAGRADDATRILDRLDTLLALHPGVASWQALQAQCAATREMSLPQLPGMDRVPTLSPSVYDDVAQSYGPALTAFANQFDQFLDRSVAIEHRKRAATLMLRKEDNAIKFQSLVIDQLERNLRAAMDNLDRAEASMQAQIRRVEEAEKVFQSGLDRWRRGRRREAELAIAGAVFSAVVGIAKIFAGKPADVAGVAAQAAKAGQIIAKIAVTLKKLEKILQAVWKLVEMIRKILPAATRRLNAAALAARMGDVRREADASNLDGAPSESAYWDQFWVEVEEALAPAIGGGVSGATEYLRHLKVLIIYGRAMTAAQTAIAPIAQELAQANLLAKLAEEQHEATARQIESLEAGVPSSVLAATLWARHRSVRRAVFVALRNFDAAHRYWALTSERAPRDPNRPITDHVGDLLDIADLKLGAQRALERFDPRPQDFIRVGFEVPAADFADFLRDGSFTLRFMPDFGPVAGWGRVGRVRVNEVAVWIVWKNDRNEDNRASVVEFTVQTDGSYYDQRLESGKVKEFRFIGPRVNQTFRHRPARSRRRRENSIIVRARVADDFRAQFSEPTLFTGWHFSLPMDGKGAVDPEVLEVLRSAAKGIELEFSGNYIKDVDRFF